MKETITLPYYGHAQIIKAYSQCCNVPANKSVWGGSVSYRCERCKKKCSLGDEVCNYEENE